MKTHQKLALFNTTFWLLVSGFGLAETVPFAEDGTLKMLYDNRMYPQAVGTDEHIYIVWRGNNGLPYIVSFDLASRSFSKPWMLLAGLKLEIDEKKFERDHHYAPVIWIDGEDRLHTLSGCHGDSGGIHLVSTEPGRIDNWEQASAIYGSISYPQVHQINGDSTLVYFRDSGHLGSWTYRVSSDNGLSWGGPSDPVVDLNREPRLGYLANHAGSYHTTEISRDGQRLHVAFIWKVEEPVPNRRYGEFLKDHTQRYNVYYLTVELASGELHNIEGVALQRPVDKREADDKCLVWDTEERVAAVPPSICLDQADRPLLLLPVSDETPLKCWYHFLSYKEGGWRRTRITRTPHPFNASRLTRTRNGLLSAYLVTGEGESLPGRNMDQYGWGESILLWTSRDNGTSWQMSQDLSPTPGLRYQNVQSVRGPDGNSIPGMILFYAWSDAVGPGTGYLYVAR